MAAAQLFGEASENPMAINITAMADVILCLCLFFMCGFRVREWGQKIEMWLPIDRDRPFSLT